jgi:type I restriction enzyme S subunit
MSFPRYPEYKETNVERLGSIPSHWQLLPCRAIVDECMDKNTDARIQDYLSLMANVGVIRYEDKGDVGNKKPDDLSKCKIVRPGNLVINSMNYGIGSYGLSTYAGVCSPVYIVLDPFQSVIETRYALRIFEEKQFQSWAQSFGNGILAHRSAIGWDDLKNIKIGLPPLEEQTQIARFLDHETAKIDALIREQERLIELLQEKRQAVISHAVTKGLDPDAPMKDSGVEWLGEVPAHWQRSTIKRIATIRYGIGEPPRYQDSGTPLIRATNVDHGTLTPKGMVFVNPKDIPQKRIVWLKRDDILVVRSGAYTGDSAIVTEEYLPAIAGFDMVLRDISCNPMFLQLALLSSYVKGNQIDLEKMRAAQPHLNAEELGSCFLFLPPSEEQGEIVDRINNKTANLDALIEQATSTVGLLKERRSALVSAAVTGKIDVRNWEPPADESAFNEEVRQAGMEANA